MDILEGVRATARLGRCSNPPPMHCSGPASIKLLSTSGLGTTRWRFLFAWTRACSQLFVVILVQFMIMNSPLYADTLSKDADPDRPHYQCRSDITPGYTEKEAFDFDAWYATYALASELSRDLWSLTSPKSGNGFSGGDSLLPILDALACNELGIDNPLEWKCRIVSNLGYIDGGIMYSCRSIYGEVDSITCPWEQGTGSCSLFKEITDPVFFSNNPPALFYRDMQDLILLDSKMRPMYIYLWDKRNLDSSDSDLPAEMEKLLDQIGVSFSDEFSRRLQEPRNSKHMPPEWKCRNISQAQPNGIAIRYSCLSIYGEKAVVEVDTMGDTALVGLLARVAAVALVGKEAHETAKFYGAEDIGKMIGEKLYNWRHGKPDPKQPESPD